MAAFKTFLFLLHIDLITTAHVSLSVCVSYLEFTEFLESVGMYHN